jgi:hypothetical protein
MKSILERLQDRRLHADWRYQAACCVVLQSIIIFALVFATMAIGCLGPAV